MLGMHLIGLDTQVMSVFCRGWRNLVILVGSTLKFSLLNVSMTTSEETMVRKVICVVVIK